MPPPPKPKPNPCCNCGGDHRVVYCPMPNTQDGRLQVCLECNTTDHAWYTCNRFTRNGKNEYFKLWVCRMGLCCIVHDKPAQLLWMNFVYSDASTDTLDMAHKRPGPSTPAFVLRMLDSSKNYADIQNQLMEGRVLPWNLETNILQNNTERINKVVLDPMTCHMTEGTILEGTGTSKKDEIRLRPMPATLAWVMNDDNSYGADEPMLDASPVPIAPRRGFASVVSAGLRATARAMLNMPDENPPPFDPKLANTPCGNCGVCGHVFNDCNKRCVQCNRLVKGSRHPEKLEPGQRCPYRCWCGEKVYHSYERCPVPCRPCVLAGKENVPSVGNCEQHCPVHPEPDGVEIHEECSLDLFGQCQICDRTYRHWPQDCPKWLSGFCCIRSDCMQKECEHCHECGMANFVGATKFQQLNDKYGVGEQEMHSLKRLWDYWHGKIHQSWKRDFDAHGKKPWMMLRCPIHQNVVKKAEDLDQLHETKWEYVLAKRRDKPDIPLGHSLSLPECPECFFAATDGTGD